jgi:hypothetical protein
MIFGKLGLSGAKFGIRVVAWVWAFAAFKPGCVLGCSPADFGKFIHAETKKWAKVIKLSRRTRPRAQSCAALSITGMPVTQQVARIEWSEI